MPSPTYFQDHILQWFSHAGRDLPWRHTRDPYKILVSEVMLQQTGVDRVLPKYHQFLAAYPSVQALAQAPMAEVITMWHPLGYNRRPVRLKQIAQAVLDQFEGHFPDNYQDLLALPGVGPYTAGAILCFAFEQDVAIIDTNIRRIIHRWWLGVDYPELLAPDKELQRLAEQTLPQGLGYAWNQALMDFGSGICTSNNPKCHLCPVKDQCSAYPAITELKKERRPAKEKFTDSNRFYRGRTLRILAQAPDQTIALAELGYQLKGLGENQEQEWLTTLVTQLAQDQLVVFDASSQQVSLP